MTLLSFPPARAGQRRVAQLQQQPGRQWLNRQQQQQGYNEFQLGQSATGGNASDLSSQRSQQGKA